MEGKPFNPFAMAQSQFDAAAELLGLDQPTRELLREPMDEHSFTIPVRMDDGGVRILRAFRVQHNDARGPCKGGIRFHPTSTLDTVRALAMWMTWKCALLDLPLGGSAGGVTCDPHGLSAGEQERLSRGFVRRLARDVGPLVDVPEPDVMTSPQHMLWMLDEYEAIHRAKFPGFITGKPVGMGGSLGRAEATGYGLVFVIREALRELGIRLDNTLVSVQGFGAVGASAVRLLEQIGARVICVASWSHADQKPYTFRKAAGVGAEELASLADRFGGIDQEAARERGYEVLPGETWLAQDVDVLIPAALENQITAANVGSVAPRVRLVVEGAHGPTTSEAERTLIERGVLVIPDFLANAGGVTCSYFEQVQSNANYYWEKDEVLGKLDLKMTAAFVAASDLARQRGLSLRDASTAIAVSRVAQACRGRGWV